MSRALAFLVFFILLTVATGRPGATASGGNSRGTPDPDQFQRPRTEDSAHERGRPSKTCPAVAAFATIGRVCNVVDVIQDYGLDLTQCGVADRIITHAGVIDGEEPDTQTTLLQKEITAGTWRNAEKRLRAEIKTAIMDESFSRKLNIAYPNELSTYFAEELIAQVQQATEDKDKSSNWPTIMSVPEVKEHVAASKRIAGIQDRFAEIMDVVVSGTLEYEDSSRTNFLINLNIKLKTVINFHLGLLEKAINREIEQLGSKPLPGHFLDDQLKFYKEMN